MDGELKKMVEVWSSAMASLCYCYFVSARLPKGKLRLISLLPVLFLFTLLPLHLTLAFPTIFTTLFLVWLANFRLLLFAFDLSPLSPNPPKSLPLFIALACFPFRIKQNHHHPSAKSTGLLLLSLPIEILLLSLTVVSMDRYRDFLNLHPKSVLVLYCCIILLMVDVSMTLSNAVVGSLLGLELDPPSDRPYFSTSLQDFWGKRWNLMVTNHLRHTVHNPVRSAMEPVVGRGSASLVGVFAAFVVSGLMHEVLFCYAARVKPTWEMAGFFVLHGACVVAEIVVKRAVSGRWRLHWAVSGPLTVGFVITTSFWLFFPPLTRNDVEPFDERITREFTIFVNFLKYDLPSILKY